MSILSLTYVKRTIKFVLRLVISRKRLSSTNIATLNTVLYLLG
jgi:hypothetical protein